MLDTDIHTLKNVLKLALFEDIPDGDITSLHIIPENPVIEAHIVSREAGVFFGKEIITTLLHMVSLHYEVDVHVENGGLIYPSDILAKIKAPVHDILKAERVLLNLIQHLSGVSTLTRQYVQALQDPHIQVTDTRKTTPCIRFLEKAAVLAGGGYNHRTSLSDMVLIKENHLYCLDKTKSLDKLANRIELFKEKNPHIKVEVEVETINDLNYVDLSKADYILFDNFSIPDLQEALKICDEKKYIAKREVSGNIQLSTISQYKGLPIHRISVGRLTHSAKALDFSLLLNKT